MFFQTSFQVIKSRSKESNGGMFSAKPMLRLTNRFVGLQSNCKLIVNNSFHYFNDNGPIRLIE